MQTCRRLAAVPRLMAAAVGGSHAVVGVVSFVLSRGGQMDDPSSAESSQLGTSEGHKRSIDGGVDDRPTKRPAATARLCVNDGKPRICLGATGSVAAVKIPELVKLLLDAGAYVDLVLTRAAAFFLSVDYRGDTPGARLARLEASTDAAGTPRLCVWRDEDEWSDYSDVGSSSVLHVDLAKRNNLLLVAPLCANTLASISLGLCGNLLTSVARAWYYDMEEQFAAPLVEKYGRHVVNRPVYALQFGSTLLDIPNSTNDELTVRDGCIHCLRVVAPAMNTMMWYQKITNEHIQTLTRRGIYVVDPVTKSLACGDTGKGAMAPTEEIARCAMENLKSYRAAEKTAVEIDGHPPFCL